MDNLVSILKIPNLNLDVKNMILRLIQNWSIAFEGKSNLSYVGQVYKTLKKEGAQHFSLDSTIAQLMHPLGYKFPPKDLTVANSAMIDTQTAPEWSDSDLCLGCRTAFTFTNRKHHCRNCGQVFDQACSSKTMPLPHYGITQEVRVCDGCFKKLTRKAEQARPPPPKKESRRHRPHGQELEDAELQRAIELSLQENKGYTPSQPPAERWRPSEPPIIDRSTRPTHAVDEEEDPDLKAAIEASLREASAPKPSAPAPEPTSNYQPTASTLPPPPTIPHYDLTAMEEDAILTFNQTMEQVEAQGGRDLSRYPAVTELYDKASGIRPKLALSLDDAGRKEGTRFMLYWSPACIYDVDFTELLSDMHSKLSEAVKLYDQILTHQVSQPRWRSAVASPPNAYQPATNAYHSTGYNTQWNAQMQPQATSSMQQNYAPPVDQLATQYASMAVSNEPQAQWAPQQQQYAPSAPQLSPSAPVPPAPVMSPPPAPVASPPPPPQFASYMPQQPVQFGNLPPVTFGQQQPVSSTPVPQSPPPPPRQVASPPPLQGNHAGLARSNTLAHASGPPQNQGLTRSNTIGTQQQQYAPQQYHPQRQQYQQQHYHQQSQDQYRQSLIASAPAPPSAVLPSAPTAAPQFGSPYGVEPERKEAMLIDL